jgi:hypothetical protein
MQDYAVNGLTISDTAGHNNALQPIILRVVSFYVGARGPFLLQFTLPEYSPDKVVAGVQNQVTELRAIDAGLEQG